MWTKKTYELVAGLLAAERANWRDRALVEDGPDVFAAYSALNNLAHGFADAFEADNSAFDRARFMVYADIQKG